MNEEDGVEDSNDEEFVQARERVKSTYFRLAQTSKQVQEEVVQGCLGSHYKDAVQVEKPQQGNTSEYEESEKD